MQLKVLRVLIFDYRFEFCLAVMPQLQTLCFKFAVVLVFQKYLHLGLLLFEEFGDLLLPISRVLILFQTNKVLTLVW